MDSINIECHGSYSCSWSVWNIIQTNNIAIDCRTDYACYDSDWNIKSNDIIFECSSSYDDC